MAKFPAKIFDWLVRGPQIGLWAAAVIFVLLLAAGLLARDLLSPQSLATAALNVALWAFAAALAALALSLLSRVHALLAAIGAMWRPIAVIAAAALLLFYADQGRELGVSLMGAHLTAPLIGLFFALVYWAINTWHAARLGLNNYVDALAAKAAARPAPAGEGQSHRRGAGTAREHVGSSGLTGDELWIFWPPRLLGVCAHFFAALNLSFAAQHQPEILALRSWWFLVWTAPAAIVLTTILVWVADDRYVSRWRRNKAPRRLTAWLGLIALALEAVFIVGLCVAFFYYHAIPKGFFVGTLIIILSALAFLFFISFFKRDEAETGLLAASRQDELTKLLFGFAVAATVLIWFFPMHVGRIFGSMVIAYFAFGAVLALMNMSGYAIRAVAARFGARPSLVRGYGAAALLLLFVATPLLRPFHEVRRCGKGDCAAAPGPAGAPDWAALKTPAERQTAGEAAVSWYRQARAAYDKIHPGDPVPMLIVATAGGGIRAAYWTATILERLETDFKNDGLRPYLYAISGVSGGSVGAIAYEAALAAHQEEGDPVEPTAYLKDDFLAPGLASWIFIDGLSNFLPYVGQKERGYALERAFEEGSGERLSKAFLSYFPNKMAAEAHWRPILLLNATHEKTGRRMITSDIKIEKQVFLDSYDTLAVLKSDVRASTAAHNSARFSYVSPAGDIGGCHGYVIDGGYFENYGAISGLELALASKRAIEEYEAENQEAEKEKASAASEPYEESRKKPVRLVILLISSDPGLDPDLARVRLVAADKKKCVLTTAAQSSDAARDKSNYLSFSDNEPKGVQDTLKEALNDLIGPVVGIMSVREAHGNLAAAELAAEICAEESPSIRYASTRGDSANAASTASVFAKSAAAIVSPNSAPAISSATDPHFAHLAMCKDYKNDPSPPVQPPLGWVLSNATREQFKPLLNKYCENRLELTELERAIRGDPPPPKKP